MVSECGTFGGMDLLLVVSEGRFIGVPVCVGLAPSPFVLQLFAVALGHPELFHVSAGLRSGSCGFVRFEGCQCVSTGGDPVVEVGDGVWYAATVCGLVFQFSRSSVVHVSSETLLQSRRRV